MLLSAYAMLRLPTLTTQNPHKILNVILKRNTATRKDAMDNCIRNSTWPKLKYDVTQLPEWWWWWWSFLEYNPQTYA